MPKKKTKEEILSEYYIAHGDRYDYSKVIYVNSSTKVEIICQQHGVFEITTGHHKKGVGCRQCYFDSQKISKQEFVRRSQKHFGLRYDYSLFENLPSLGKKLPIFCLEHKQRFLQEPRNHMKGCTGCPECISLKLSGSSESIGLLKTREELTQDFIKRAQKKHGDTYDYSDFEYINASTKGKIVCSVHGEFWQIASNHLRGNQCPQCSIEKQKENTFKKRCKEQGADYHRALKRRQAGLSEDKI